MTQRPLLLALALVAGCAAPAAARDAGIPHLTTRTQSCAAIQGHVARHGAAVLTFGPRASAGLDGLLFGYGFDRVAQDARSCLPLATLTPIWVPARDTPQCFAGYTCSEGGGSGGGRHAR